MPKLINCKTCKKEFSVKQSEFSIKQSEFNRINYCSRTCFSNREKPFIICLKCNKKVIVPLNRISKNAKYCSRLCKEGIPHRRKCQTCGKEFQINPSSKRKACSLKCRILPKRPAQIEIKNCQTCGKKFLNPERGKRKNLRKFCSFKCRVIVQPKREAPSKGLLMELYYEKKLTMEEISKKLKMGRGTLSVFFKEYGLATFNSFGKTYIGLNGLNVKSSYELRVCNWLVKNNFSFEYEPLIKKGRFFKSDFLVNGCYIEIWGMTGDNTYKERMIQKKQIYKKKNLKLISLYSDDFNKKGMSWKKILESAFLAEAS